MFEEKGQPVFDLDLGSPSDSQEDSSDDEDDEDVMANLPDHLSRAMRGEDEVGTFRQFNIFFPFIYNVTSFELLKLVPFLIYFHCWNVCLSS